MDDIKTSDVLDVFRKYIGLKLHFNSEKYIYDDSFGHDRINDHSMNSRKDIDTFISVSDKYLHKQDELKEILISLFKKNPSMWIGEVLKKSSEEVHTSRISNIYNISNIIERDLGVLSDYMTVQGIGIDEMLNFNNDRPLIVKKLKLSDEFLSLLDFCRPYLIQKTENPLWKKRSFILYKYKYLINTNNDILSRIENLLK